MAYRNGNYAAFYVAEPFEESNLGANQARDFVYYNLLRAWKAKDETFPFVDSHEKTYNVRDDSDWESTLKPRLRKRLVNSKNIVLFLSSETKDSRALREEIDYGANILKLPIVIVYPDFNTKDDIAVDHIIKEEVIKLWNKLPVLRTVLKNNIVPTLHIVCKKNYLEYGLQTFTLHNQNLTENKYTY